MLHIGSKQINDIINSKIEKDKKEVNKIRRVLTTTLVGKEVNGVKIKEITEHISERLLQRNIKTSDLIHAVDNPLFFEKVKYDKKNRPSFKIISEKATFYVNPIEGKITTLHKTSSSVVKKYKEIK